MVDRILCIDDDPITLMISKKVLFKFECTKEVATSCNGECALKYLQNIGIDNTDFFPNLIFLDLNMPIVDGWEFLEIFKDQFNKFYETTKIIILSSSIDPKDIDRTKKYPFVMGFMPKPITTNSLKVFIENKKNLSTY